MSITRREFVQSAAAAAALGLGGFPVQAGQDSPDNRPLLISSANGVRACARAFDRIRAGADPLDAVVEGINVVEDDPNDHSVGYGGLPNEDGVVELDSCVMDGRVHKAGAVAALQHVKNPSSVALKVMRRSDHVLLVGEGALRFARAHGFPEQELLTDEARRIWLDWKEKHSAEDDWLHPEADQEARRWEREEGRNFTYGTITCMALTAASDLVGCTSTSGLSYKIPGRVGDSPILGAGLYVDNEVGACGSTGRGEANLQNLSSFAVVELMRGGMSPQEACMEALRRIAKRTEKRLRDASGNPNYQVTMYAIRKDGQVGGASLMPGVKMTVHDASGSRQMELSGLFAKP